jgi:hypothetical protein
VSGNALTTTPRNGTSTTVQLKGDAKIIAVEKGAMSDIKDNSFVGITALAQPGGAIKAVEVHVFAEPLPGIGEGHYAWDLMPNSTMTNAAVTHQVKKVEGNTLSLKYKDGEKTIVVPSDAPVVNLVPGDKADLKARKFSSRVGRRSPMEAERRRWCSWAAAESPCRCKPTSYAAFRGLCGLGNASAP